MINFWGVVLVALVVLWLAVECSPETRENMEEIHDKMRLWWSSHELLDPAHADDSDENLVDLVDESHSRRYKGTSKIERK